MRQSDNAGSWATRTQAGSSQSQPSPHHGGVPEHPTTHRPPTAPRPSAILDTPPHCTTCPMEGSTEAPYQDVTGNNITPLHDATEHPNPTRHTTGRFDIFAGDVDDVSSEGLAAQDKTAFSQPLLNDNDIDEDAVIVNPLPFAAPATAPNPPP
jgi:hypothetical protein